MNVKRCLYAVFSIALVAGSTFGQPPQRAQKKAGQRMQNADARFAGEKPAVGDPLPKVTIFDEMGKPFNLASQKGSYVVLVFGCLT